MERVTLPQLTRAVVLLAALILVQPVAAAYVPVGDVALPGGSPLPSLPLARDEVRVGAARTFEGPDGETVELRLASPVVYAGERALLMVAPAAADKIDPALLDVAKLAKRGLVGADADVRVIVEGAVPLPLPALATTTRVFPALGLTGAIVDLADLEALALSPQVERVFLDERATTQDVESFGLIRVYDVHARNDTQGSPITGQGVTIAIVDTGVDHTHPELGGCLGAGCKVVGGYDFVNGDAVPMDDHGHGTHVADTAAGLHGVAPGADVLAYKVLNEWGSGWYTDIIAAIENATFDGADIISMSLGGFGTSDGPLSQAVDWAVDQGVVVVSAAGNSGCYGCIGEPAAALKGIAVGASTKWDAMAPFSSRGPVFDSNGTIVAVKPDVSAPGVDILAAVPTGDCDLCDPSGFRSLSGTSMATPHVSGVAALLLQDHPAWTPADVLGALSGSGVELMLDAAAHKAYDSRTLGASRIDALSALDAQVSILPGNGYLGLDVASPGVWESASTLTVKAIGRTPVDVDLSARLLAPSTATGAPTVPVPDPTSAPDAAVDGARGAAHPADNSSSGPIGPVAVDLTVVNITRVGSSEATLRNATGATFVGTLAPFGCTVCNATFPNVRLDRGVSSVYGEGFRVDFLAGYEDVVDGLSASALSLLPGQSATVTLDVAVRNDFTPDAWADGRVVATSASGAYSTRTTFVKSGVIHLALDEATAYVFGTRDGIMEIFLASPPGNLTILAPEGVWDFQAVLWGCPANVVACQVWDGMTVVFEDGIVHEGESNVDLLRPAAGHRLDTTATWADGTSIPGRDLPYCNWEPSTTGCHNWGETFFSREQSNGWFGLSHYNTPMYVEDTVWRIGRDFEYARGTETYLVGDYREGVHEDWTLVRNASSFDRLDVEYQPPVGTTSALQISYCHFTAPGISFGIGNGRAPQARTEAFYFSANDPGRIQAGYGMIPSMPCGATHHMLIGSTNGVVGNACYNGPGCFGSGRTPFFEHDDDGFHAIRSPFDTTRVPAAYRQGATVANDGAPWFDGRVYAGGNAISVYPHWDNAAYDYVHWFTPASGGAQYLGESDTDGAAYTLARDGIEESNGTLGRWGISHWFSEPGEYRLTLEKEHTRLATLNGSARHVIEWNASSTAWEVGTIEALHVVGDDGVFRTAFTADVPLEARFGITSSGAPSDVTVSLRNLQTNAATAVCCAFVDPSGLWHAPLPGMGMGPIEMTVSYAANGTRVALVQTPAYVVTAPATAPKVAIASPREGDVVRGPSVAVNGTASDIDGNVTLVEVRIQGGDWRPANGTTSWTYAFDPSPWLGNVTIEARAFDGAEHSDIATVRVRHEGNAAPWVLIDAPTPGESVAGTLHAAGRAFDPDGADDVAFVMARLDGGGWVLANGTTNWTASFDVAGLANGTHSFDALVQDHDGATSITNTWFEIRSAPDLVVANVTIVRTPIETSHASVPNDAAERRTVRAFVANVGGAASPATHADARADATAYVPGTTSAFTTSEGLGVVPVPALAPGETAVVEWTWDTVGNVGDHVVVARIDAYGEIAESREDNNEASARSWVAVGGLGGAALLAPIDLEPGALPVPGAPIGQPASSAAWLAYDLVCAAPDNPQCRAITGRPVIGGQLALCEGPRPALGGALQTAAATLDATGSSAGTGPLVCRAWFADVAGLAWGVDALLP